MTDDDDLFDIVPARPPVEGGGQTEGSFARGPDWSIDVDGDVFLFSYLSGEHGGGERTIAISDADARALRDGQKTADDVLIAYRAS